MSKKQDRQGVRTAVDLERKYKFSKQFKTFNRFSKDTQKEIDDMVRGTTELTQHVDKTYTPKSSFEELTKGFAIVEEEVDSLKESLKNYAPKSDFDSLVNAVGALGEDIGAFETELYELEKSNNSLAESVSSLLGTLENLVTFTAGESNGWYYRKWSDGRAECWKLLTHKTTISTQWGNLYYGTATSRQSYPVAFIDKPTEIASLTSGSYQAILFPEKDGNGVNGASASACYNVCRPSRITSSAEFYISIYVVGKWK